MRKIDKAMVPVSRQHISLLVRRHNLPTVIGRGGAGGAKTSAESGPGPCAIRNTKAHARSGGTDGLPFSVCTLSERNTIESDSESDPFTKRKRER